MATRHKLRPLIWVIYAVALLFVVVPLTDVLMNALPMRIGDVTWRFGAAGLLSNVLMLPIFGVLMAVTAAVLVGHRLLARTLAVLAFLGAVLGGLAIAMFFLDAIETRGAVRPEAVDIFYVAAGAALGKYVLGTITAVLLGVGAWKASRRREHRHRSSRETSKARRSTRSAS